MELIEYFKIKPMELKKLTAVLLLVSITFFSCTDETLVQSELTSVPNAFLKSDNHIPTASLPQPILDYISTNYPDVMVVKAEQELNGNYEVYLENGLELIFNENGDFLGIDNDGDDNYGDSTINPEDLPQAILDYIGANYPEDPINYAELENNGNYEIELLSGLYLIFDSNGAFLGEGVDDDESNDDDYDEDDYQNIDPSKLPQSIHDYIAANYPEYSIIQAELEVNGNFEVTLNNGVELYFDSDGNFISAEDENGEDENESDDENEESDNDDEGDDEDEDNDSTDDHDDDSDEDHYIDPSDLPQTILDYIATNYPDNGIISAEIKADGHYEVTLDNGIELTFDADGNFLEEDNSDDESQYIDPADLPQVILDYVTTHFPNETIIEAEIDSDGNYEVSLSNGYELYFDKDGNFIRLDD